MAGRQAKILTESQLGIALRAAGSTRYSARDKVMLLLSTKSGLRAAEIAGLTWPMLTTSEGKLGDHIALANTIAKKGSGRTIPIHPRLRSALLALAKADGMERHVIKSERAEKLSAGSIVNWFKSFYARLGFEGCSSHSGRRTFITMAARRISKAGGSIKDVQMLAGHRSLRHTQGYIEGDSKAQQRLMRFI